MAKNITDPRSRGDVVLGRVPRVQTFEEKVRADYFRNPLPYSREPEVRAAYDQKEFELHTEFMGELKVYLIRNGVPEKYAAKVSAKAYEDGHADGYSEVLNVAMGLMDIFA